MVNKIEKGCTFGLVLQQRVTGMEDKLTEGFDRIDKSLKSIKDKNEQMFNHMSDRPSKNTTRQVNILIAVCSTLAGMLVTLFGMLLYGSL